jgi:hypothetical protein
MKAISERVAEAGAVCEGTPVATPTMATMYWQINMPTAPQISSGRRPKRSMV